MARILIAEDDVKLAGVIDDWLTEDHHEVELVSNGPAALAAAQTRRYDVVILDWILPGMTGIEVCRQYRIAGGTAAIIMLTGRRDVSDKEAGLDAGADDYLTKPFSIRELAARVRAVLRRSRTIGEPVIQIGNLVLNSRGRELTRKGRPIHLMPREFALLELFMRHPGKVFSQDDLLDAVWGNEQDVPPDTVRVHIARLRAKIDEEGAESLIRTVHRVGYKLEPLAELPACH